MQLWQTTGEQHLHSLLNLSESEWYLSMISFLKGDDLDVPDDVKTKIKTLAPNFRLKTEYIDRQPTDRLYYIDEGIEMLYLEIPF
jgi:hypothetical protein